MTAVLLKAGHVASGSILVEDVYGATDIVRKMKVEDGRRFSLSLELPHKDVLVTSARFT